MVIRACELIASKFAKSDIALRIPIVQIVLIAFSTYETIEGNIIAIRLIEVLHVRVFQCRKVELKNKFDFRSFNRKHIRL